MSDRLIGERIKGIGVIRHVGAIGFSTREHDNHSRQSVSYEDARIVAEALQNDRSVTVYTREAKQLTVERTPAGWRISDGTWWLDHPLSDDDAQKLGETILETVDAPSFPVHLDDITVDPVTGTSE
jgi:hypothetical protein